MLPYKNVEEGYSGRLCQNGHVLLNTIKVALHNLNPFARKQLCSFINMNAMVHIKRFSIKRLALRLGSHSLVGRITHGEPRPAKTLMGTRACDLQQIAGQSWCCGSVGM